MTNCDSDFLSDLVFDFLSDNYDEYCLDPQDIQSGYKLFDFEIDRKGRESCSILFSDDDHVYTVTNHNGNIEINY